MGRKRRHPPISYRPPVRLRTEFDARVLNSGLPTNAFITKAIFGLAPPHSRPVALLDRQTAALLLSQAARISDRLPPQSSDPRAADGAALSECRAELAEIRTCLMLLLGREP